MTLGGDRSSSSSSSSSSGASGASGASDAAAAIAPPLTPPAAGSDGGGAGMSLPRGTPATAADGGGASGVGGVGSGSQGDGDGDGPSAPSSGGQRGRPRKRLLDSALEPHTLFSRKELLEENERLRKMLRLDLEGKRGDPGVVNQQQQQQEQQQPLLPSSSGAGKGEASAAAAAAATHLVPVPGAGETTEKRTTDQQQKHDEQQQQEQEREREQEEAAALLGSISFSGRSSRMVRNTARFEPSDFRDTRKRERVTANGRDYGPTAVRVDLLPEIYHRILAELGEQAVECALDQERFPQSSEMELYEHCLHQVQHNLDQFTIKAAFVGEDAARASLERAGAPEDVAENNGLPSDSAIATALQQYNRLMDSKEMREKRNYRIENHEWTEEELKRFEEAIQLFPNSATANRKIAAHIGGSVHPNQVVYLKSQYRLKKRREWQKVVDEVESEERAVPYDSYDYDHLVSSEKNADLRAVLTSKKKQYDSDTKKLVSTVPKSLASTTKKTPKQRGGT